jgi:hypothetical protein
VQQKAPDITLDQVRDAIAKFNGKKKLPQTSFGSRDKAYIESSSGAVKCDNLQKVPTCHTLKFWNSLFVSEG